MQPWPRQGLRLTNSFCWIHLEQRLLSRKGPHPPEQSRQAQKEGGRDIAHSTQCKREEMGSRLAHVLWLSAGVNRFSKGRHNYTGQKHSMWNNKIECEKKNLQDKCFYLLFLKAYLVYELRPRLQNHCTLGKSYQFITVLNCPIT